MLDLRNIPNLTRPVKTKWIRIPQEYEIFFYLLTITSIQWMVKFFKLLKGYLFFLLITLYNKDKFIANMSIKLEDRVIKINFCKLLISYNRLKYS